MNFKTVGIIVGIVCVLFVPFLGHVHLFDWDEINFAECAREMVSSGNYATVTIDYLPFWEKPPLFIWMQAISMKVFGINEFAARFPNVLAAIFTALSLVYHGAKQHSLKLGLWWAAFFIGSFLPNVFFHSGIIDPWFNLFIFNSIAFYFSGISTVRARDFLLAGILAGLAVMTKGPVAIILIGASLFIFHLTTKFKSFPKIRFLGLTILVTLFISLLWFLMLLMSGHREIIGQFLDYQVRLFQTKDAGHGGPFYYHWIVLLLGCFPASFFAISALFRKESYQNPFNKIILIAGLFTLILFSIVQTKIIHYSSFCYFFLTYFAAFQVVQNTERLRISIWITLIYLFVIGSCICIIVYLHVNGKNITSIFSIKDAFARANLSADTPWHWRDFTVALIWVITGVLGFYLVIKNQIKKAVILVLIAIPSGIISIQATILPHIEHYTQGAALEFYKSKQNEDVYIIPLGFKSYAQLFYGNVKPHTNLKRYNEAWVCSDSTDLPVYYVARIPMDKNYLKAYPNLKKLYMKNGFVFLRQKNNLSLNPKVK